MWSKISALVMMVALVSSLDNWQRRYIWYIDAGGVCDYGANSDMIELNFNLDGFKAKTFNASGKTTCSQWAADPYSRLVPTTYWTYIENPHTYIRFDDETKYSGVYHWLISIAQNTTLRNPVKIDGVDYNCTILGDGKTHFAVPFLDVQPAKIDFKCDNLTSLEARSAQAQTETAFLLKEESK